MRRQFCMAKQIETRLLFGCDGLSKADALLNSNSNCYQILKE